MSPLSKTLASAIMGIALVSHVPVVAQLSTHKAHCLFVYNFTKYIQWPDGAIKDEFVIGVYGKSPIVEELEKMSALKKAGDKTIRVIQLHSLDKLADVHILFIPEDKSGQLSSILEAVHGKPVLLVTEGEGLIQKGAAISFFTDQNNLKFELNSNSIVLQKLKVSKQLEALAFKRS